MKDRIKSVRKEAGLTQTEFGNRLGVKHASVSQWESGINKPDERSIKSISREFNVNYSWLVDGIGDMRPQIDDVTAFCKMHNITNPDELHLIKTYFSLNDEERNYLVKLISKLANKD